jgi:hypothetical protein
MAVVDAPLCKGADEAPHTANLIALRLSNIEKEFFSLASNIEYQ